MNDKVLNTMVTFCHIQLSLIKEREIYLRKQIQDCKIQEEFLLQTISDISKQAKNLEGHGE